MLHPHSNLDLTKPLMGHMSLCTQVPLWSRIGRLKRTTFPKLTGGGHAYGGGAGPGTLSTIAGRLLCDTYLSGVCVCVCLMSCAGVFACLGAWISVCVCA